MTTEPANDSGRSDAVADRPGETRRRALGASGLSLDALYLVLAIVLVCGFTLLKPVPPHDYFWHLAEGRWIVAHGRVPTVDQFSFTRTGAPFFDQGWLAQLVMYALHQAGGVALGVLAQCIAVALGCGLVLAMLVRRTGAPRLAALTLLLAVLPISHPHWNLRPQVFAVPLFASYLDQLDRRRTGRGTALWLLPVVMTVWVNVHGSFVLGLALVVLALAGDVLARRTRHESAPSVRASRQLAGWGAAAALATLANPRGAAVFGYVAHLLRSPAVTRYVSEWLSPNARNPVELLFYAVAFGTLGVLAYARRRPAPGELLAFAAFLYLALTATRNTLWFAMVAAPLLADGLAGLPGLASREPQRSRAHTLIAAVLLAGLIPLTPWLRPRLPGVLGRPLLTLDTPVAAVAALRRMPASERPRRLCHSEGVGSYLTWAAPEQPVFIDPRFELYPLEQWRDVIAIAQDANTEERLARYGCDGVLLNRDQRPDVLRRLRTNGHWRVAHEDSTAAVLLRRAR